MILRLRQGVAVDSAVVSFIKLGHWIQITKGTMYYRSSKSAPKVLKQLIGHIEAVIEETYPSVTGRWRTRLPSTKAPYSAYSRSWTDGCASGQWASSLKSKPCRWWPKPQINAVRPGLCRVWTEHDMYASLALVVDCNSLDRLGLHISGCNHSKTA